MVGKYIPNATLVFRFPLVLRIPLILFCNI